MPDDNRRNLEYFEAPSMRELFLLMQSWQTEHRKRFQSLSVEASDDKFCCIALTNPTEVIIVDGSFHGGAQLLGNEHALLVTVSSTTYR